MSAKPDVDIVVVGAGPAGTAAAIYAAQYGLRVSLLDQHSHPKHRPGESLPPGIEIIFRQLGIWNKICKMNVIRYPGHFTLENEHQKKIFHPYGSDHQGPWQGFQIHRDQLDRILQERAQEVGVNFFPRCHVKKIQWIDSNITLSTASHHFSGSYYLDAAGGRHLFAKSLGIEVINYSPILIARFGYLQHDCPYNDLPIFIQDEKEWTWYAKVDTHSYAWVKVKSSKLIDKKNIDVHPASGGADVTWRIAKQLAGPPFFLLGDAACVLDPSAGHGVLRAFMSGIMSAFIILKIIKNKITPEEGYRYYHQWMSDWFNHDVNELQKRQGTRFYPYKMDIN